jgi:type IV pilus assembly protein PilE
MILSTSRIHNGQRLMRKRQSGVTLMELLTVIIVISILASLAVPSYRRYLLRAQRSDATTALLRMQSAQEKHFLQYGVYVTTTASIPNATTAGGLGLSTVSERGFYNITVANPNGTGYTLTATPVAGGGQSADTGCVSFSVTEAGTKQAFNSSSVDSTTTCFR